MFRNNAGIICMIYSKTIFLKIQLKTIKEMKQKTGSSLWNRLFQGNSEF